MADNKESDDNIGNMLIDPPVGPYSSEKEIIA